MIYLRRKKLSDKKFLYIEINNNKKKAKKNESSRKLLAISIDSLCTHFLIFFDKNSTEKLL